MKITIDLSWMYTYRFILLALLIIVLGVTIVWIGIYTIPGPPPVSVDTIQNEMNAIFTNDNINDVLKEDLLAAVKKKYSDRDIIFNGRISKFTTTSLFEKYEITIIHKREKIDDYHTFTIQADCHMDSSSKEFVYALQLNQKIKVIGSLIFYHNVGRSWYYNLRNCVEIK